MCGDDGVGHDRGLDQAGTPPTQVGKTLTKVRYNRLAKVRDPKVWPITVSLIVIILIGH